MDYQVIFDLVGGAILGVFGWFARQMWEAVDRMRNDLSKLREELPKTYITKDDFREGVKELKELLTTINNKLDRKQDK